MSTEPRYERFPIVKRGYDPKAVESHLSTIDDENDRTLDEAASRIAALEKSVEEARKHEEAVHLTILAATTAKENLLAAAQQQADETRAAGRKQGDSIITDARMQAFQVVTEARSEADDIIVEARSEAAAIRRSNDEPAPVADDSADREGALQHRIEEMQNVIADMESALHTRLSSPHAENSQDAPVGGSTATQPAEPTAAPIANEAADASAAVPESMRRVTDPVIEEHIEIVVTDTVLTASLDETDPIVATTDADTPADVLDPEPSNDDSRITDNREAADSRPSFYSRRSAKLPRIGVEAGRSAMAAAAGLRTSMKSGEATKSPDSDLSQELETV